ncbi:1-3-beta-D-glucan synthase [Fragilaria crotonensis]|nr:1-3-beta-D-glucan synthase [Fragilaria crotonensis]
MIPITVDSIFDVIYPLSRLLVTGFIIWYASGCTSQQRLFSGFLTAVVSGFLTFTFLEPLFFPVGLEVAIVALYILSINAAFVGMSLGVLLPLIFPGLCFGVAVSLFAGCLMTMSNPLYFPVASAALGVVGAILSARWSLSVMLALATILVGGGVASTFVVKSFSAYLMDVARGYQFHPSETTGFEDFDLSISTEILLGLVWTASSVLVAACLVYRDGSFRNLNFFSLFRSNYTAVPTTEEAGPQPKAKIAHLPSFRDPPANATDAYNVFDPADLPPRLAEYANMVYSACEDLGNFFGFQDSSVRNQAEHLLILLSNNRRYMSSHILPVSVQPPSPIHALHAKVFSNYMKWCRAMSVPPNFSKMNTSMSAPPAVGSRVVDLVLWFYDGGVHTKRGYSQTRSLYAGHYLDNVVGPLYEVVAKNMSSKSDHVDRRNYDDFNEFFWSRNCLKFRYSSEIIAEDGSDVEAISILSGPLPGESLQGIADGLANAPKTFLEKRSWLRGVLALHRLLEWHIVTFYLLSHRLLSRTNLGLGLLSTACEWSLLDFQCSSFDLEPS